MKEVKELLGLKGNKLKVIKIEEMSNKNERIQEITLIGTTKKVRCPSCGKYTSSIYDILKNLI